MSESIFELEQNLLQCWHITDDIEMVTKHFVDDPEWADMSPELCDALMNKYFGLRELYELRFQRAWHSFEKVCTEYHQK